MFRARLSLSCLLSAALVAAGCSKASEPEGAPHVAPKPQARALSTPSAESEPLPDGQERTFESIPSPAELLAQARESMGDKYDEKVAAEVEQELAAYAYKPSEEPEPALDPGEPLGTSFLADTTLATEKVAGSFDQRVEVRCAVRPCLTRGDFDGDGRPDLAIQVTEREEYRTGIALLIGDAQHLLAAGTEGELGDDLLWLDAWHVEPSAKGLPIEGEALGAVLVLDGAERHAAIYFVRDEKGLAALKVYRSDVSLTK
jgi:hypothetical protein